MDRMTARRTELSDGAIHVRRHSEETMPADEWDCLLSILDGSANRVLVCDFDLEVLNELMAQKRGLTLQDLNKRSECSSGFIVFRSPRRVVWATMTRRPQHSLLMWLTLTTT